MDLAVPGSERFINAPANVEAREATPPLLPAIQPALEEPQPPLERPQPAPAGVPPASSVPQPQSAPPSAPAQEPAAAPGAAPAKPAGSVSLTIFRLERERLAALHDLNWRRIRLVLWVLVIGVGLGVLLLLPPTRTALAPLPNPPRLHVPPGTHPPGRPLGPVVLFAIGLGVPLLALALGVIALPLLLSREVQLRRQRDLHLALGRQGLLFFLPGRAGYWFLLPWGHIAGLSDATITPPNGRRASTRTVFWRRLARLRRVFRHGRHLGESAARRLSPVRSPFLLHARRQQPRQMLQVDCYARLPGSGYGWLFRLAPFIQREGPATFLLETGWFEPARPNAPAGQAAPQTPDLSSSLPTLPKAPQRQAAGPGVLHRVLLNLWSAPLLRAQRPALPLPRSGGAVILNAMGSPPDIDAEARRVDWAAWAALPLVPALSVVGLGIALLTHQPLSRSVVLNTATLCVLTVGLGLLLAGVRRTGRGRVFAAGAALLTLAGLLNLVYGLVDQMADWPWRFEVAPGQPLLFLELLAGLLITLGAGALALEGSGRPGSRPTASSGTDAVLGLRPHSTELALALGLFALSLGRVLEDLDRAVLSSSSDALLLLRGTLAEPLLPLAIIGLSYFAPLAGPGLQSLFRILQAIYGLALALLVPAAFILVHRATQGTGLLPLPWLLLLVLALACGLLVALSALLGWRAAARRPGSSA